MHHVKSSQFLTDQYIMFFHAVLESESQSSESEVKVTHLSNMTLTFKRMEVPCHGKNWHD